MSTARFSKSGVSFQYPTSWTLEEDETAEGWTATVQSPGTAFLLISFRPDADDPAQVADQTLDALKAEYPELDSMEVTETIASRMAIGFDIDFVALDTTVSGRIRALDAPDGPLLILTQCSDLDRTKHEPDLKSMVTSLEMNDE